MQVGADWAKVQSNVNYVSGAACARVADAKMAEHGLRAAADRVNTLSGFTFGLVASSPRGTPTGPELLGPGCVSSVGVGLPIAALQTLNCYEI